MSNRGWIMPVVVLSASWDGGGKIFKLYISAAHVLYSININNVLLFTLGNMFSIELSIIKPLYIIRDSELHTFGVQASLLGFSIPPMWAQSVF